MKCSSRSTDACITSGGQLIKMATSWTSWCKVGEIKSGQEILSQATKRVTVFSACDHHRQAEGYSAAKAEMLPSVEHSLTLNALHIPLLPGIPHDYRRAFAPRVGFAYSPGRSSKTVISGGIGVYFNDFNQNGWVDAFRAVNEPFTDLLAAGDQDAVIDPQYHTPYALQFSFGVGRVLSSNWRLNVHYEHQQGVHQYRRYEYVSDFTLPATAPSISLFRTDNRSRYGGVAFLVQHSVAHRFELSAHYTLSSAKTWGRYCWRAG
jgi:hypothetical protein